MKRCPECRRDYYDDSLLYCLDDGRALLEGPASGNEPVTAILAGVEAKTVILNSTSPIEVPNSIAVLPFAHMSSADDNEYFCDGLAEELINALSKIDGLKVAARTSAFSFKGKDTDISEIARKLSVKTVLEGSVRKSGDRIRVTVQLINAADGYHLWSERYDREINDIFAVQDEITLAVVDALKVKLLQGERSAILKKATDNPEAYQLYLRGRAFWNRRTPADFEKAIDYFQQAIAIDPEYSLAYSGIADSYTLLTYFEVVAPHDFRERIEVNARKAAELDPSSAEAQTAMALYKLFGFDLDAAEDYFRKAVELNPKLVTARYLFGTHLATRHRFDEAIEQQSIALELDPLSQPLNGNVARVLYFMGKYEDAIKLARKNLELAPDFFFTHWVLGVSYREAGDLEKALLHLRKTVSLSGIFALKGDLGVALAKAGKEKEARDLLAEMEAESKVRYVSPQWPAVIYAALGERETALAFLENAWQVRGIQLLWLDIDPNFDPLRSEPKFIEILNESGVARNGFQSSLA
jgi:adenylate cyclase